MTNESIFKGQFTNELEALKYVNENPQIESTSEIVWKKRQEDFFGLASEGRPPRWLSFVDLPLISEIDRIVDFGGGSGWLELVLKKYLNRDITYINIETKKSISMFQNNILSTPIVIDDLLTHNHSQCEHPALLYSNSVIQYPGALDDLFKIIKHCEFEYIVLDDIPISNANNFITLQKYYDSLNLYYFFNPNNLIIELAKLGYKLDRKMNYPNVYPDDWKYQIDPIERETPIVKLLDPVSLHFIKTIN